MKEQPQKILIVDDSRIFTNRLSLLLRESGSTDEVIIADNYDDGLDLIMNYRPAVIFLDIHLNNKSGIDLLKVIHLSGWNCKVIMLTNETRKAYRQQCAKFGSAGFLDKSNDFEGIPELIKEL